RIAPVEKGKGSVEDGIEFIKSFKKVYIHSRCKETLKECREYSYKKDRLTDEVLPIIIDKDNHYVDALRYALEKVMKRGMGLKINMADIESAFGR
uniref:terminase large subunit n=1 Tax=Escherichia coli TaxID=562 RepID=UPI001F457D76